MGRRTNEIRRSDIIAFILAFREEHGGIEPTIREIASAVGIRSVSVMSGYLERMQDDGLLSRERVGKRVRYTIHEHQLHV